MGACNACETWDERRYWKWEEHPIPEEPTAIGTIPTQAPQRTEPGPLTPTPFPTPLINIQNAPAAPEPGATVAGTLGLLGKPGLFTDITGLDQTQQNALQAMLSNEESAKHFADKASQLALQAASTKTGPSTVEGIKQAMRDGTLDQPTGQQLIADAYRAQISGQTSTGRPANTANNSDLAQAGAAAVRQGRPVKVTTDHPDGTSTTVDQLHGQKEEGNEGSGIFPKTTSDPYAIIPIAAYIKDVEVAENTVQERHTRAIAHTIAAGILRRDDFLYAHSWSVQQRGCRLSPHRV